MTRTKLTQEVSKRVDLFKGHTDGRWYETGHNAYMTAEFSNVAQATMFAQYLIWDLQVITDVQHIEDIIDNPAQDTQVTIKRWL